MGIGPVASALFTEDWIKAVSGALALVVVLAMFLERALSVVFEWGMWDEWLARNSLRAPITLVVSYVICSAMQLDLLHVVGSKDAVPFSLLSVGTFLTAGTIAGGSKGAIALFQNVLNFSKGGTVAPREAKAAQKKQ
ncbi:MAG: hypothetical protein ABI830_04055 [Pseudolabrys sp.]